ncbi:MAG: monovalent cation/H+ antiporter complex subunit F [Pseudonocardia sp.]|jgi:multicomponent Na+:H+ antiporter subunit F
MVIVVTATLAMISAAALLTIARMLRGPSTLDRIVCLDVLVVLAVAAAGVYVAYYRNDTYLALIAAVALVGFVGSATAARLVERRDRHR